MSRNGLFDYAKRANENGIEGEEYKMPVTQTPKYNKWSQQTLDFIQKHRQAIKEVANSGAIGGISAAALAGAMAKECNTVLAKLPQETIKDVYAMINLSFDGVASLDFSLAQKFGLIDRASVYYKPFLATLMDMGPFNTQGATALRALEKYTRDHPFDDPLDLKEKYSGKPSDFIGALTGLSVSEEESVRVAAAVWGLRMAEAKEWFESKFFVSDIPDLNFIQYWNGLTQEKKDALYAEWVISGPVQMEKNYEKNVAKNGHYEPTPSEGGPGGWDVQWNSAAIAIAMDISYYGLDPDLFNVDPNDIDVPLDEDEGWLIDIFEGELWNPVPYDILMPFGNLGAVDLDEAESRLAASKLSVPKLASLALRLPRLRDWLDPESEGQEEWVSSRIDDALKSFLDAQENSAPPARRDPLIVDLNGDGIKTTTVGTGTYFDHDADAFAERTA
ncbi:MAG: hypothetical protein AB1473_18455 [Thermodesulfobacteriota bacterium]